MTPDTQEISHQLIVSKNPQEIFKQFDIKTQGTLLLTLTKRLQKELLTKLEDDQVIELLNHIPPDKSTDLLQTLEPKRSERLTAKLDDSIKAKVEFLLKFNPRAAAGIMTLDYVEVSEKDTFKDVAGSIKDHEEKTGKVPTVLVVEKDILIGEIPVHTLALHSPKEHIKNYLQKIPSIKFDEDERKVISFFLRHPHNKVVVLDEDDDVLGIIHSDDILSLLETRNTHNLYNFAGVNREEDALDSALTKVKYRWKWLIVNLGTAFLAAGVVGFFEETISKFVLLAVYMPVVAGMGGNAGTQTLAVTIRGLVLKEINLQSARKIVANEMVAGGVNGAINGVIVAFIASFFNKNPALGFVLAVAMVVNLVVAGFFGAAVPVIMKGLGRDPASSATVFITTATDVLGFFVFLGLAKAVL